jgi:clan AA aspartic protease (TIGR02281 family)
LALLSGLGPLQACSTAAPPRVASVPIQTINRKFLVPVVLNEGQTATFLLDTGASTTVITPDLARRLGIDTSSRTTLARARIASGQEVEVSMVRMTSIRVGSARLDNLNVAVYELPVIVNANPPITVDGFLGVDFIGRFTMIVDPAAGTLTLQLAYPPPK